MMTKTLRRPSSIASLASLFIGLSFIAPSAARAAVCQGSATAGVSTIQSAINAVPSTLTGNYCIAVGSGTYGEEVVIAGINTNGFTLSLVGPSTGTAVIVPLSGSEAALVISVPNVTVSGLTILAGGGSSYVAEIVAPGATLSGDVFQNDGPYPSQAGIVLSGGASGATITGSTVATHGPSYAAVYIDGVSNTSIIQSVISDDNHRDGIYEDNGAGLTLSRSTVTTYGAENASVSIYESPSNTIASSVISDTDHRSAIIIEYSSGNTISMSTVTTSGAENGALYAYQISGTSITGSTLSDGDGYPAIYLEYGSGNQITSDQLQTYGANDGALELYQNTGAVISQDWISDSSQDGDGVDLTEGSFNTVSFSTVTTYKADEAAVFLDEESSDTVTHVAASDLSNGGALYLNDSQGSLVSFDTFMNSSGFGYSVVYSRYGAFTAFTSDVITGLGGFTYGFEWDNSGEHNTLSLSTVTVSAYSDAIYVDDQSSFTCTRNVVSVGSEGSGLDTENGYENNITYNVFNTSGTDSDGVSEDGDLGDTVSWNTVNGANEEGDGLYFQEGSYNTVTHNTVTTRDSYDGAIYEEEESTDTFTSNTASDIGDGAGFSLNYGEYNVVSLNTIATASGTALSENEEYGGLFTRNAMTSGSAFADVVDFEDGHYNTLSFSTITTSQGRALSEDAEYNGLFTQNYLSATHGGDGLFFSEGGNNVISWTQVVTSSASDAAAYFENEYVDTVTFSSIRDLGPGVAQVGYDSNIGSSDGLYFQEGGSNFVSFSTVTTNGAEFAALYTSDDDDVITNSVIADTYESDVVSLQGNGNSVTASALNGNSTWAWNDAILEIGGNRNAVSNNVLTDPSAAVPGNADGIYFDDGASYNTVTQTTVTISGAYLGSLYFYGDNAYNTVANSNFTDTAVSTQTGATNSSVFLDDQDSGSSAILTNDRFAAPAADAGIYLTNGQGVVKFNSDVVTGVSAGLVVPSTTPPTSLDVLGLAFQAMPAGSVGIKFLSGGTVISTFSSVSFDASVSTNVNALALSTPSAITMLNATGAHAGPSFDIDPNSVVAWGLYTIPAAVTSIAGTAQGTSSITWTWNGSSQAMSYKIFTAAGAYLSSVATTTYAQTGLNPNQASDLSVLPVSIAGNGPLAQGTTVYTFAASPSAGFVIDQSSSSLTIGWTPGGNPNGTRYELDYSTFDGAYAFGAASSTTSATLTGLLAGTTYNFAVRAENAANVFSLLGSTSSALTLPAGQTGCAYVIAGENTIQSVVNAIPSSLSADYCLSIGAGTYYEQVTVQGVNTNGHHINISAAPGSATISLNSGATAGLIIANANVNVTGLAVAPGGGGGYYSNLYGIAISSAHVTLNGIFVYDPNGYITEAGVIAFGAASWTTLENSTVTTGGPYEGAVYFTNVASNTITGDMIADLNAADGIYLETSTANTVTQSTVTTDSAYAATVHLFASSANTFSGDYLSDPQGCNDWTGDGFGLYNNSNGNQMSADSVNTNGACDGAVYLSYSSSNTVTQDVLTDAQYGNGVQLYYGSGNTVSQSTVTTNDATGVYLYDARSNTITQSVFTDLYQGTGLYGDGTNGNTISYDVITTSGDYSEILELDGSASNTVTNGLFTGLGSYDTRGVYFGEGASNTLSNTSVTTDNSYSGAVYENGETSDIFSSDTLTDIGGREGLFLEDGTGNVVSNSVLASNNLSQATLYEYEESSDTITGDTVSNTVHASAIKLQYGQGNVVSNSVLSSTDSSNGALYEYEEDYDTFTQDVVSGLGYNGTGVYLEYGYNNAVAFSTVTSNGEDGGAIAEEEESTDTFKANVVSAGNGGVAYVLDDGEYNTVSQSTVTTNDGYGGINADDEYNDLVTANAVSDPNGGDGIYFSEGGDNTFSWNVVVTSAAEDGSIYEDQDSPDLFTHNTLSDMGGGWAYFLEEGSNDVVEYSSATTFDGAPLWIQREYQSTATLNDFTDLGGGDGAYTGYDSEQVTISFSTITTKGAEDGGIYEDFDYQDVLTRNTVTDLGGGSGIYFAEGTENTVSWNNVNTIGAQQPALFEYGEGAATIAWNVVSDTASADGIGMGYGYSNVAVHNTATTRNAPDGAFVAMNENNSSATSGVYTDQGTGAGAGLGGGSGSGSGSGIYFAFSNSTVQGATGAWISGGGISMTGSTITATQAAEPAVYLYNNTSPVLVNNDALTANAQGTGIYVDIYNNAYLSLAGDTLAGGNTGLYIATATPGLVVSNLTFSSLSAGATGVYLNAGTFASTFSFVNFGAAAREANVAAAGLNPGSTVLFANASGDNTHAFTDDPSNFVTFGTVATPAAPVVTFTTLGISSITVNWSAVANATGYNFYPPASAVPFALTTTSYTKAGLQANSASYIRVAATDNGVQGPLSIGATGYTLAAPVSYLNTNCDMHSSINISWGTNGNTSNTQYQASIWTLGGSTTTLTLTGSATTFAGLAGGATYYFQVAAVNMGGGLSAPVTAYAVTPPPPPGAPTGLSGVAVGTSQIVWTWRGAAGAVSYDIDEAVAYPGEYDNYGSNNVSAPSYTETDLQPNTPLYAQVDARSSSGAGALSVGVTAYTLAAPVYDLYTNYVYASSISLSWYQDGNFPGTQYQVNYGLVGQSTSTLSSMAVHGRVKSAAATPNCGDCCFATGRASPHDCCEGAAKVAHPRDDCSDDYSTAVLTNLSGGTTYFISVVAINGAGIPAAVVETLTVVTSTGASASQTVNPTGGTTITLNTSEGTVTVQIPQGTFGQGSTLTLSVPTGGLPTGGNNGAANLTGTGDALQVDISQAPNTGGEVEITIPYDQADLAHGLNPETLVIAQYDPFQGVWVALHSTVNLSAMEVTAYVHNFYGGENSTDRPRTAGLQTAAGGGGGLFQLMGSAAASNLSDPKAYPNPFRPALGETTITFANLPAYSTLKIYDILGEKVREISADVSGMATWDGRNSNGNGVASGVYFVLAGSGGSRTTFKVAIQR